MQGTSGWEMPSCFLSLDWLGSVVGFLGTLGALCGWRPRLRFRGGWQSVWFSSLSFFHPGFGCSESVSGHPSSGVELQRLVCKGFALVWLKLPTLRMCFTPGLSVVLDRALHSSRDDRVVLGRADCGSQLPQHPPSPIRQPGLFRWDARSDLVRNPLETGGYRFNPCDGFWETCSEVV